MRRWRAPSLGLLVALLFAAHGAAVVADEPSPLTLSAESVRGTCTIGSVTTLDYSISGGVPPYRLTVDGRSIDPSSSRAFYTRCRPAADWTRLKGPDDEQIQRIIVSVVDAAGVRAYSVAEQQLVRPLPAPRSLTVTSGAEGRSAAALQAEWTLPDPPGESPTGDVAFRWRAMGSSDWTIEHRRGEESGALWFRSSWTLDAPLGGKRREVQVAQIRHILDLQAPQALSWPPIAVAPTADHPRELQAVATHDAVTLSWGPHAPGVAYIASLVAVEAAWYETKQERRLDAGPLFEVRFDDLLPDTLYRVAVRLDQGDRQRHPLPQHRFEIRTEPAPAGWSPPTRLATDIRAVYADRKIAVSWTPPETGSRHGTRVCVTPSDLESPWTQTCALAEPGASLASISPHGLGWTGGSYQVVVSVQTLPSATAIQRVHLPTYAASLLTRGEAPPAPRFAGVEWWHGPANPAPGSWQFEWAAQEGDLVEVLWRVGDRWFYREHSVSTYRVGQLWIGTKYDVRPLSIRYRILRHGVWTPWSAPSDAPDMTRPPHITRVEEYRDRIQVQWHPAEHAGAIVGYRLYVSRNGRQEEVLELGSVTQAEIPLRADDEDYYLRVAALTDEGNEAVSMFSPNGRFDRRRLSINLGSSGSWCQPTPGDRAQVTWTVTGGAVPFIVAIGDQLGFQTWERAGSTVVDCPWGEDQPAHLEAMVTDGRGDSAITSRDLRRAPNIWEDTGDDPPLELGPRSVERDRVFLSWRCYHPSHQSAIRWRVAGDRDWTYHSGLLSSWDGDRMCRAAWRGLEPLTSYEYQLARIDPHEEGRPRQTWRWTEPQTLTTLGDPIDLEIERSGETVAVRWTRQPDAWAYVVRLRSEGRSWWKRYEPVGDPTEAVYFYRIPESLSVSVELNSPPLEHGEAARPRRYDADLNIFHE